MATNGKLRQRIAWEAARLMYEHQESEYYRAKLKASRQLAGRFVKPKDLPSNAEIRDQIQVFARLLEGDRRLDDLLQMRIEALRMMRLLRQFRPRLIGSTLTGHVRRGSDIDLHVFSNSISAVAAALDHEGIVHDIERKEVRKHGEERVFTHIHIEDHFPFELTVYSEDLLSYHFKSSITGKSIDRASLPEFEQFLAKEYPDLDLEEALAGAEQRIDRFQIYHMLLLPLEKVKQPRQWHPEGDVLYHSLQVFDRACDEMPYDEEFLLAALLHDVGKGIDPGDHVMAGLDALAEYITPRTRWLIEHHMEAQLIHDGTIGVRARRRLSEHEDYEALMTLCQCDRAGRVAGAQAPDLEEALDYLRELSRTCGE
jgi:hypothetical protein